MSVYTTGIQNKFRLSDVEFEIRRLEVELDFHREKSKLIEEAIHEKQRRLDRLQTRLIPSRMMERDGHE